jgi:hypothetical protein
VPRADLADIGVRMAVRMVVSGFFARFWHRVIP